MSAVRLCDGIILAKAGECKLAQADSLSGFIVPGAGISGVRPPDAVYDPTRI